MKQLTMRIDATLHHAIKKLCFDRNMSINSWLILVLAQAVREEQELMSVRKVTKK